ncbi:MAG: CHRD domain-containing protein, partial [Sphingomicrobium sp.]
MKSRYKVLFGSASAIGAAALGVVALQAPALAQNANATTNYRADLRALPNTRGQGTAMLRLSGDKRTLTVQIRASGLERGPHLSHIHG